MLTLFSEFAHRYESHDETVKCDRISQGSIAYRTSIQHLRCFYNSVTGHDIFVHSGPNRRLWQQNVTRKMIPCLLMLLSTYMNKPYQIIPGHAKLIWY